MSYLKHLRLKARAWNEFEAKWVKKGMVGGTVLRSANVQVCGSKGSAQSDMVRHM